MQSLACIMIGVMVESQEGLKPLSAHLRSPPLCCLVESQEGLKRGPKDPPALLGQLG